MTGSNVKFLLLHQPPPASTTGTTGTNNTNTNASARASSVSSVSSSSAAAPSSTATAGTTAATAATSTSIAANPTSPQTEEAVRSFFLEVYENWVKAAMSPFYRVNMEVRSPVFRQRVAAAGRKYL